MMELNPRRIRSLIYGLLDLQSNLRLAGFGVGAESVGKVAGKADSLPTTQFLDDTRAALETALLGERDLRPELLEEILQTIAYVDDLRRAAS